LIAHGAHASAIVLCHAQNLLHAGGGGAEALHAVLACGVTLCIDGFGCGCPWLDLTRLDSTVNGSDAAVRLPSHPIPSALPSHPICPPIPSHLPPIPNLSHLTNLFRPHYYPPSLAPRSLLPSHRLTSPPAAGMPLGVDLPPGTSSCVPRDAFEPPPSDAHLAATVASLLNHGAAPHLVLSHATASRMQYAAYGGAGLSHLSTSLVPHLLHLGCAPHDVTRLRGSNGGRLLSWWRPAPPPPRVCKAWVCSGCQRSFEEAVNPAEALPTDQGYYEKMAFRYCSMHCLSSHRKAGFPQTFACAPPP
jgi:hypothetical protein